MLHDNIVCALAQAQAWVCSAFTSLLISLSVAAWGLVMIVSLMACQAQVVNGAVAMSVTVCVCLCECVKMATVYLVTVE